MSPVHPKGGVHRRRAARARWWLSLAGGTLVAAAAGLAAWAAPGDPVVGGVEDGVAHGAAPAQAAPGAVAPSPLAVRLVRATHGPRAPLPATLAPLRGALASLPYGVYEDLGGDAWLASPEVPHGARLGDVSLTVRLVRAGDGKMTVAVTASRGGAVVVDTQVTGAAGTAQALSVGDDGTGTLVVVVTAG